MEPLWVTVGLTYGLLIDVAFGPVFGLRRGGATYLRRFSFRSLLTHDQLAPWDCIAFLDRAAGLILLRRRGCG
jgi:hypothetical protein